MSTVEEALQAPAPATGTPAERAGRSALARGRALASLTFLGPNLLMVLLFLVVPLVWALLISFQKLESIGPAQFLGINNYVDLFQDPVFYETLVNTVIFTVCTVPVGMAIGLGCPHRRTPPG